MINKRTETTDELFDRVASGQKKIKPVKHKRQRTKVV